MNSLLSYGCDCKYINRETESKLADRIVIARIIEDSKDRFTAFVIDGLKGTGLDTVKVNTSSECSVKPQKGELWLLYIHSGQQYLFATICGNSRSFRDPVLMKDIEAIEPKADLSIGDIRNQLLINKSHMDLYFEILDLKSERDVQKINDTGAICLEVNSIRKYGIVLMASNVLTLLLLVFFLLRRGR